MSSVSVHVEVLWIWLTSLSLELSKTLLAEFATSFAVQGTASMRCALRPPMSEKCPTSSPMPQADPSRHVDDFPHGSSAKVLETKSSPLIQELKGNADAGDMPSRGRRGGVADTLADKQLDPLSKTTHTTHSRHTKVVIVCFLWEG